MQIQRATKWFLKFSMTFKKMKRQFWDLKLTLEVVSKSDQTSKYILDTSAVFPAQFSYIRIVF